MSAQVGITKNRVFPSINCSGKETRDFCKENLSFVANQNSIATPARALMP